MPKFMIIPENREKELKSIKDPLFLNAFRDNNWLYTTYENIDRLTGYSKPSIDEIMRISKSL
jgi:hypothetical protein